MRVAVLQMNSGTEPGPNLDQLEALAAEAAARGATYLQSPEVSVVFAENREGLRAVAGPWEGNPAVARVGAIAKRLSVSLHLGSLAVALPDGRFANRSVLFRPDGTIAATYDKIHLFDATLPGLRQYRESETYAAGRGGGGDRRAGLPARHDHLLRPALSGAASRAGRGRRRSARGARRLHRSDRRGALGSAAAGPRHRDRLLGHRRGAGRHAPERPLDLRQLDDHRSLGQGRRAARRGRPGDRASPTSTSLPSPRRAAGSRPLPTAAAFQ